MSWKGVIYLTYYSLTVFSLKQVLTGSSISVAALVLH